MIPRESEALARRLIERTSLNFRAKRCLFTARIHTVDDLAKRSVYDLRKINTLGVVTIREIERVLAEFGLQLRYEMPPPKRKRGRPRKYPAKEMV